MLLINFRISVCLLGVIANNSSAIFSRIQEQCYVAVYVTKYPKNVIVSENKIFIDGNSCCLFISIGYTLR